MLSDILKLLRIRAEVYHNAKVCGDWLIPEGHLGQTCFHLPIEGNCLLDIPGSKPVLLDTGDMVLFPREIPHSMYPADAQTGPQQHLHYAKAEGKGTGMLCGRMIFEHTAYSAMLDALPQYLIVSAGASKQWLPPLLDLIQHESYKTQPNKLLLDRLCELIFIYILSDFVANGEGTGLLKLYSIERINPAVQSIHEDPARNWTLESLASICNMSRTNFAKAFRESDWTPMQYLTWWRMQLAYTALQAGDTISNTAEAVGYQSDAAFSRAFFKAFSLRPGQLRKAESTEAQQ